jgi:hypothetical protein
MYQFLRRLLAVLGLMFCCLLSRADASNLTKADIERMVDYFYVVGEVLPDLPVYPLFVKDTGGADAKPELKAYVFESVDFAPARGYSGKPINLLIIMDVSGNFLKIRLLDHREPLFLDSAGNLKLERFASQYKGLSPRHTVEIGPYNDPGLRDEQVAHLKGVQQGTISVKAINRAILQSAAAVATATNTNAAAYKDTKDIRDTKPDTKPDTKTDTKSDVKSDTKPSFTAEESRPSAAVKPVADSSESRAVSEKKSGTEDSNSVTVPGSQSPTARTLSAKAVDEPGTTTGTTSDDMRSAQALSTAAPSATVVAAVRDADVRVSSSEMQDWISAWQSRSGHIGILLAALVALSIALVAQKRFSVRHKRLRRLRTLFLLFTVGFIGWTAQGQLTIVNITAAIESLSSDGDLSFFLNDPMTVILWVFVGLTLLVWGRGTFCGWLCPFGALQELISLLANALGRRQRRLRAALDARLKWIKYLILAALMVSLYASPPMAEWLVEVEPFKTAISLYFVRDWPYLAWAIFCLLLSVFVYRGYCRYLCPLGAALASLGFLRVWSWIPRRSECGAPCQTCRHRCEYQAITPAGKIDYQECFQCLDCVSIYQDTQRCFPLIKLEKKTARPA